MGDDSRSVRVSKISSAYRLEIVDFVRLCRGTNECGCEDSLADVGVCAKDVMGTEMAEKKGHGGGKKNIYISRDFMYN